MNTITLFILAFAALLTACGGGSDEPAPAPAPIATDITVSCQRSDTMTRCTEHSSRGTRTCTSTGSTSIVCTDWSNAAPTPAAPVGYVSQY